MLLYNLWLFLLLSYLPLTLAQFQFFEQMFGQGGHQQRHAQGQPGQWTAQADASTFTLRSCSCIGVTSDIATVQCSDYLCPKTLTCVPNPAQCPCPDPQDVKCLIPDSEDSEGATVVCVRGGSDCSVLERLAGI